MGAIIRDPKDNRRQARVGTPGDGTNPGDGLVTHAIAWLTEPISGIRRLWRGDETGFAKVSGDIDIIEFTPSTYAADALDAADVAADTEEVPNVMRTNGGTAILQSLTVLDSDDQNIGMRVFFFSRNVSLGTEDAAISISDANAKFLIGSVTVGIGEYADTIASRFATKTNIGLTLKAPPESKSIYMAVQTDGAPTYTASGLLFKLGILRQ